MENSFEGNNRNTSSQIMLLICFRRLSFGFHRHKVILFWSQLCDAHFMSNLFQNPTQQIAATSWQHFVGLVTISHAAPPSPSLPRDSCNHFSSKCIWAPPLVAGSCLPDPCDHFSKCKSAPWWSSGGGQLTTCCLSARMIIHQAAPTNA